MRFWRIPSGLAIAALLTVACSSPSSKVESTGTTSRTSKPAWSDSEKADDAGAGMADDGMSHDGMSHDAPTPTDPMAHDTGAGGMGAGSMPNNTYGSGGSGMAVRTMGDQVVASRAFPTGNPATSAVLLEKVAPKEVMVGQPYAYQIRVKNLTQGPLEQVVVTDVLSDTYSMSSANPSPVSRDGGVMTWAIGDLGPGETRTVEVNGTATSAGSVTYCSEVAYLDRLCLETAVVEPALRIVKRGPAEVLACDTINYEIEVRNEGSGTARNVRITDMLPDGLTATDGSRQLNYPVGDLSSGQSKTVNVSVRASRTGTFDNRATAEADGGLTSESNSVTTRVSKPELDIAMSCDDRRFGGQNATYRVVVTNKGDAACNSTVLDATIPAGTTFVSASNGGNAGAGKVTWMLGAVAPGDSVDVEFAVRGDVLGPKTSNATASCVCSDPVNTSCTTDIQGIPAVLLEVIDLEDPVPVGGQVTYEIQVTNQGSLIDTNIQIVCTLENEMEFVSATGATAGSASGSTVTFAPLPSIAPKERVTWRVVVRAGAAGDVRFAVKMDTDQLQRPVDETEATHFYN